MRYRLTFVVVVLTLAALSPSQAGYARTYRDLTVHEWGTFTSIAGENGTAIEWTPQAGPQDLPCFVNRFRFNIKGWMPGRIRMETPVLYFYAPRDMIVNVSVRFRQGMVTEWYPDAAVAPSSVSSIDLRSAAFESSITWRDVMVAPRAAPDFPDDERASHYYTARNTDASPLQLGTEAEKFLFYRGIGGFEPPLTAAVNPDGTIVVANRGDEAVGDVVLFENRGGAMAYEIRHVTASRVTFDPLSVDDQSSAPLAALERILTAHGLFPKEARAMVQTWRDSWFEEGTRLFYVAPRTTLDAILPLDVTPPPAALERVFVGRIELVTPATEAAVRDAIARNDVAALRTYSRFVDAIAGGILSKSTPAERARTQALLHPIDASWATSSAACQ